MDKFLIDESQLKDWVEAAEGIREQFGISKALGYLIGEKFYNIVRILQSARKTVINIDEQRKNPSYNPIRETGYGKYRHVVNLDDVYEEERKTIFKAEKLLIKFAVFIKEAFEPYEIRQYFESNPRLGAIGHTTSEEEHELFVTKGVIEHSVDTEIENALIFGEMLKYFQIS